MCPPCDLINYGQTGRTIVEYEPVRFAWHAFGVQGLPWDEQVRVLRELSPINFVTKDMPPTLIFHGDAEEKVPHKQSERFAATLKANNVPHQLVICRNAGHGWPDIDKDYALLADWFDEHLRQTEADSKSDGRSS